MKKPEKNIKKFDSKKRVSRSNIVVDYAKLQNILFYVFCGLIAAVALFSVIFYTVKLIQTNARIETTKNLINKFNHDLDNIDEVNEEYAYDQLWNHYDRVLLIYALSELWSYSLKINGELLTEENFNSLTDVEEGEEVEIVLTETMMSTGIPYKIAAKGNSRQGDPNDELRTQFYIANNINYEYDIDETGRILTYKFTKGNDDVKIRIFPTLAEKLGLPGGYDFYYELILK